MNTPAFTAPLPPSVSAFTTRPATVSAHPPAHSPARRAPLRRSVPLAAQSVTTEASPSGKKQKKSARSKGPPPSSTSHLGKLIVMGLSHHTATVDLRERLAVPEAEWQVAAAKLCDLDQVSEAAVLSTCNRFEVYIVSESPFHAIQQVVAHLSSRSGIPVRQLRDHLFMLTEHDACWHLLRVSAGLDSLVIGEGQILSQVKKCYELATEKDGFAGKILTRLLNITVSAGKRVRSETGIAKGAVSISSAAVELADMKATPELGLPLEDTRVCIIGAGKMSRLLVQHLVARSVQNITIVNRSVERAEELVKMFPDAGIEVQLMPALLDCVAQSDIVFASTGAEVPILSKENVEPTLIADRRYMFIDISVPRNVAQDVTEVDNAASFNVDDLKAVVARNQARRRRLMVEAEVVLQEEMTTFVNWHNSLACVPAISKLQQRAESIRQDEMERIKGKLAGLSASELKAVEQLSKGIVNKMLHSPMVHLRELEDIEERTMTLKHIEALFKL